MHGRRAGHVLPPHHEPPVSHARGHAYVHVHGLVTHVAYSNRACRVDPILQENRRVQLFRVGRPPVQQYTQKRKEELAGHDELLLQQVTGKNEIMGKTFNGARPTNTRRFVASPLRGPKCRAHCSTRAFSCMSSETGVVLRRSCSGGEGAIVEGSPRSDP